MKKSNVLQIVIILVSVFLGIKSTRSSQCSKHVRKIGDAICLYRHEHGEWPKDEADLYQTGIIPGGTMFETIHGNPIYYDVNERELRTECPHGKSSAHGVSLNGRYEYLYE